MIPVVTGLGWAHSGGLGRGNAADTHALDAYGAPCRKLPDIRRRDIFTSPCKDFGRMDAYSRLGLAAVAQALEDARLGAWTAKRPIGLIAATVYGCLHTDIDYYHTVLPGHGEQASPALFTYTLPNCFLGDAAIHFGLTGPAFVVSEPGTGGMEPVLMALESLMCGEAEQMLCGVCDLGRPQVFDRLADTAAGALFFVLEARPPCQREVYGSIQRDCASGVLFGQRRFFSVPDLALACLEQTADRRGS
jgi:3-oxoacyl-[acyl-carrier-protein] synthase II